MKETYKILIVDDEPSILDMLKLQLESEGYVVYTAINAKEALDKLSNCPDIILLDINMSGMNGLDLCVSIRDFVTCPILFLTARVSEQDKINGLMAGGDDYITKPFSMSELLARLSAHLRRETEAIRKRKINFQKILSLIIRTGAFISKTIGLNYQIRNLKSFSYYLQMQDRSLTEKKYMRSFGGSIVTETAQSSRSIYGKSAQSFLNIQRKPIFLLFGEWGTNG